MSERLETKRCTKAQYKYSSFLFYYVRQSFTLSVEAYSDDFLAERRLKREPRSRVAVTWLTR